MKRGVNDGLLAFDQSLRVFHPAEFAGHPFCPGRQFEVVCNGAAISIPAPAGVTRAHDLGEDFCPQKTSCSSNGDSHEASPIRSIPQAVQAVLSWAMISSGTMVC
jgi:hypothetical protein